MNLRRIIIVSNVLVCFVLNNLLFTYSTEKKERVVILCDSEGNSCCMETETIEFCCEEGSCCAQVPVQSAHINVSVIIGVDKKSDTRIAALELANFYLSHLKLTAELSEGHLNSLIKPPAFT